MKSPPESATPTFFSFHLYAVGIIQLLNTDGRVMATGTYSFTNNQLTAIYRYNNGAEFSISGALQNNTLSRSWGAVRNGGGVGRWVVGRN